MITYKIHLIRTGTTAEGLWKPYVGQTDLPLSTKGINELNALKEEFQYPMAQKVYTSPLVRCTATAEIFYPNTQVAVVKDLMDMNLGEFEGKSFEDLKNSEDFNNWIQNSYEFSPPGGEATANFNKRIVNAISGIFTEMMQERLRSVAVVTHGGVIMSLLAAIGVPKLPLHQWAASNGAGYTLQMTPQLWMRDQAAEVFSHIPSPKVEDDMNTYGLYYND